jgi:hypothetical protein
LASADSCSQYILTEAIVIAKLKLRDIERHILFADLVERADDATLEDRPAAINRLSVDRADNVVKLRPRKDGCLPQKQPRPPPGELAEAA